jgi:signal transduction histidine kinase
MTALAGTAARTATAHQRLAAQHAVARIVAEAENLAGAAPRILQAICECLDWDIGMLWVVDRAANRIRCAETWMAVGVNVPEFVAASHALVAEEGESLPGHAWRLGRPVWIDDLPRAGPVFVRGSVAARSGLHGAIAFPIVLNNEVLAVMDFLSHEVRRPDGEVLDMLTTFGTQIGQFIERKRAEEALRASEQQLQAIINNTSALVYVTDLEGRELLVNHGVSDGLRARHLAALQGAEPVECEEIVEEHGIRRTWLSQRFRLHDREGRPYALCGVSSDITDRKQAEDDLRSLAVQLSVAEDAERRRLARDVHDSIGQTLSALKIELARLGDHKLHPSLELVDHVIAQIRSLTFDLYPSMLDDLGLLPTLESFVEQWSQRSRVEAAVRETGERCQLPLSVTNYLFRAIKELLSNVAKHARATQVLIAIHWQPSSVRIAVNDDGVGFDPDTALAPQHRRGLGLADIRERVQFLGGRMLIDSTKAGSQIVLELPIERGKHV